MNSSKPPLAKNLIKIGCITEARSLQGEVRFHLFTGEAPWAAKLKTIFLQPATQAVASDLRSDDLAQPEKLVEYKVSSFKEVSGRFILKLQGVNDRNAAESLRGFVGWIPETFLQSKNGESIFLREVLGFHVYDDEKKLGPVTAFESNGPQDLLVVDLGQTRTTLVPFIKEFITKIDYAGKNIYMSLPEGLVDLYLDDDENGKPR